MTGVLVRDIMTTDLDRVPRSATLADAAERMLRNRTNHVVVMDDETDPVSLITRRKALLAALRADDPLSEIPVTMFGRGFKRTVSPDRAVLLSVAELKRSDAECLPIVEDHTVVGVLTQADVVANVSSITKETMAADERAREWSGSRDTS